ncbi:hypothetical protein [Maledivibacter halophilus]|uniref:Uncharacterized protein n=1 Tax=Maledivibacter halophilus TaxID=36842 RepID=A0A1T5MHV3_9FIRM|nr:hypothetical protein [Maledivibacter halophilus]SKC87807.1 hypothetical protein SAMN02194393_04749 [Maledivibacter halophilus]
MKRSVTLIIIITIFLVFSVLSFGQTKEAKILNDGTIVNRTSSHEYLIDNGCSIDFYISDNRLVASAYTNTYIDVTSIYVKVYIQRYSNGSWVTIDSKTSTVNDSKKADVYLSIKPLSSGQYRAYAIHKLTHNGKTEKDTSNTKSIIVNKK